MGGRRSGDATYVKILEEENMEIISKILGCEMLAVIRAVILRGTFSKEIFWGEIVG